MKTTLIAIALIIVAIIVYTQFTIFVMQPIGALPEGRTVIILRLQNGQFIDSADAMCDRAMGRVSLLCRGMMAAMVVKNSPILLRFPYSETLYRISTNGKIYTH